MTPTDSDYANTPGNRRDRVRDEFAAALAAGQSPRIEEFVERVPHKERPQLLECLIHEHLFRREKGELPTLDEYKTRFRNDMDAVERAILRPPGEGKASEGKDGVRYAFIRQLGTGAQAPVYLASDTQARQRGHSDLVAIKVFDSTGPRSRFDDERHFLSRVRHQHVVSIIGDPIEEAGRVLIVLQYIDGSTLEEKLKESLKNGERFKPEEAANIPARVARALDYVHRKTEANGKAIVHCDIKPAKIILDRDGEPHLLDFGIAALTEELTGIERGGGGTYEYMSPEQLTQLRWETTESIWSGGTHRLARAAPQSDGRKLVTAYFDQDLQSYFPASG